MIDQGIKQPLRFYDSLDKQNWRRSWVTTGLQERATLINPKNTILPFQVRRRRTHLPVTTFDLYRYDGNEFVLDVDVLTLIPAPETNHLKIVQMTAVDNIIWFPVASFVSDLDCGYYYIHLSDTKNDFYSEVFRVWDFSQTYKNNVAIMANPTVTGINNLVKSAGNPIISTQKTF